VARPRETTSRPAWTGAVARSRNDSDARAALSASVAGSTREPSAVAGDIKGSAQHTTITHTGLNEARITTIILRKLTTIRRTHPTPRGPGLSLRDALSASSPSPKPLRPRRIDNNRAKHHQSPR
jgi:hypothetical protein